MTLVDPDSLETLDVLGPTVQFLVSPEAGKDPTCAFRGTIPPGGVVPLHSHADPETFVMVSGRLEALSEGEDDLEWIELTPGDVFRVPGGTKHAFRNPGDDPAEQIVLTTGRIGRFFREVTTPAATVERFLAVAEWYGYWNASPEENAAVGIRVS
jgi:quercetin dioxygenase-like cupin family protein